jgi:hypothetical protein
VVSTSGKGIDAFAQAAKSATSSSPSGVSGGKLETDEDIASETVGTNASSYIFLLTTMKTVHLHLASHPVLPLQRDPPRRDLWPLQAHQQLVRLALLMLSMLDRAMALLLPSLVLLRGFCNGSDENRKENTAWYPIPT